MPTVLIVDDDAVVQLLLRVNFEMEGFSVEVADDGEQALALARATLPDLILLDVVMPKMNGYEVLESLQKDEKTRQVPVVLLSAKAQEVDKKTGMEAGARLYITKPFDPVDVLNEVRELISA